MSRLRGEFGHDGSMEGPHETKLTGAGQRVMGKVEDVLKENDAPPQRMAAPAGGPAETEGAGYGNSRQDGQFEPTPAPAHLPQKPEPVGGEGQHADFENGDMHKPVTGREAAAEAKQSKPLGDEEGDEMGDLYGATTQAAGAELEPVPSVMSEEGAKMATYASTLTFERVSTRKFWLHGELGVVVYEAVNLPNKDLLSAGMETVCCVPCRMCVSKAEGASRRIHSDPYAAVDFGPARVARTRVIKNAPNPRWNERFTLPIAHEIEHVVVEVKDADYAGAQLIGTVKIPAEVLLKEREKEGWFDVINTNGNPAAEGAKIKLGFKYTPMDEDEIYKGMTRESAVPRTYFPLRKGGRVTLYQDAHVKDGLLPQIELDGGKIYQPGRCWEDICKAIVDAKYMVYIVGWSVFTDITLVRDPDRPMIPHGNMKLGDLLKWKAKQKCRVLLMVWDDRTSQRLEFVKITGVMDTHDEDTKRFFRRTKVKCKLVPRYPDESMSTMRRLMVGSMYTHHQKTVIVDTPVPNAAPDGANSRTLLAFLGGIDLCNHRYDDQHHSLFRTMNGISKGDFENGNIPTVSEKTGGPREPWHDIHCKVEGAAAWDVYTNFLQRWHKVRKTETFRRHGLLKLAKMKAFVVPDFGQPDAEREVAVTSEQDPENWHVQVFRSIDSGSVKGFPTAPDEVFQAGLVGGKGTIIDMSIQDAYVHAIRRAQRFIYIENQYFLGSCHAWKSHQEVGAWNLIPVEIALKIVGKIREGKQFRAYVLVPMWPEGDPTSGSVQEILFWQARTMEMMYSLISKALKEQGLLGEQHPRDYLTFFCLGNREVKHPDEPEPVKPPKPGSVQDKCQKSRRAMIYVHSKLMIVDDEYVIVGSANINQRSQDGSRDTEIAMGGYQPAQLNSSGRPARGQVYGFRTSLWAEHLGHLFEEYKTPESVECVRKVNAAVDANWQVFAAEEITEMTAHLMAFPVQVNQDGSIQELPGTEEFPDTGGRILGTTSGQLPDALTT
ncbi:phospholipase D [Klebsormidium nitens]|uniref:phospholipase D n=1 Tax=Klebsormidium nitens TaxID=105231 RepID=A0A1Y1HP00_KLENI|nr:phospholipase D [Klebsormidium nitens]|eukprot:GAQ78336.1 phospholipase D [Klebsormidium nitens]